MIKTLKNKQDKWVCLPMLAPQGIKSVVGAIQGGGIISSATLSPKNVCNRDASQTFILKLMHCARK
jgi:hypothetical protein